jgi:pimeloyl-ACP methyl ester carboxylesterase
MQGVLRWWWRGVALCAAALLLYVVASVLYLRLHERGDPRRDAPSGGRFLTVGRTPVFFQVHGPASGTPVLLVHGTAAWSGTWFSVVPTLERAGYRVIAVDLPPFGYSNKSSATDFSRRAQALRLQAVLDAVGVHRVVVVGHSFGAGPALELALRAPSRVGRLVLVDAALGLDAPPPDGDSLACRALALPAVRHPLMAATAANPLWSATLLRSFVARKDAVTASRLRFYRRPAALAGASHALGAWAFHFACERESGASTQPDAIARLTPPLVLLWGTDDTITPPMQGRRLQALVPGASLTMIPGAGHIPHIEQPVAFERALLAALWQPKGR